MTKKAFLFDLDGTLIHSMPFHLKAWEMTMEALGSPLRGDQLMAQLYGHNTDVFARIFGPEKFTVTELHQMGVDKEALYREIYRPHIRLIDGLPAFLTAAKNNGIVMAIGTASNAENVELAVSSLQLNRWFDAVVGANDVVHGKPHPETYLKAAERLGVPPENCIVFEDVPKGVEAAQNAGMQAVVVTTTYSETAFTGYANIIKFIPDFSDIRPPEII
jgi:beta-phosphoglucomutase